MTKLKKDLTNNDRKMIQILWDNGISIRSISKRLKVKRHIIESAVVKKSFFEESDKIQV